MYFHRSVNQNCQIKPGYYLNIRVTYYFHFSNSIISNNQFLPQKKKKYINNKYFSFTFQINDKY
jgi:hypothetical protein